MRCGEELVIVEKAPERPKPTQVIYSHDEYVKRLENSLCFVLKSLRIQAHLQQKQVAARAGFGARSYVSKVENPLGKNRTIPKVDSLRRFSAALNIEMWKIIAMAEEQTAGRQERNEWLNWWHEMVPLFRRLRRMDRDVILATAHSMSKKALQVDLKRLNIQR